MDTVILLYRGKLPPTVNVPFLNDTTHLFFHNTMTISPPAPLWQQLLWDLQSNVGLWYPTWHDDIREAQFPGDWHTTGEKDHVLPS